MEESADIFYKETLTSDVWINTEISMPQIPEFNALRLVLTFDISVISGKVYQQHEHSENKVN